MVVKDAQVIIIFNFFSFNFFTIIFNSTFLEPCPRNPDVPTECSPSEIQVIDKPTGCVYLTCGIYNQISTVERSVASTGIGEVVNTATTQPTTTPHFTGIFYTNLDLDLQ